MDYFFVDQRLWSAFLLLLGKGCRLLVSHSQRVHLP